MIGRAGFAAVVLVSALPAMGRDADLDIDPPHWWTGFADQRLQLAVYGDGIANAEPAVAHPDVTLNRVVRGQSPNYLFLYLVIPAGTPPGDVDIRFASNGETLRRRYELKARDGIAERVRGFTSADAIYLITPDRFANGDTGNDVVDGLGDVVDRREPYARHGGDLEGLRRHLDYVAGLGFTMVWLNPVLETAMPRSSYHGYATTDFYSVDPRFGSNELYREVVAEARDKGIGMIMDMIVNHAGALHRWVADPPTGDWINHAGRFQATTHARTSQQDPYAAAIDRQRHADGWFVESMPDLNQRNPLLADYLVQNAIWWIEYLGLSGIRMDTWPYPDKQFLSDWAQRILAEYPDLNIVGEEWSESPAITSYWQRGKQTHDGYVSWLPSLFDFPLQAALSDALAGETQEWISPWRGLYELIGVDYLYPDPMSLVVFADNHDMDRIYTQLDENDDLFRMALVFVATMRGIPQVYYGTEILASHPGTSSHGVLRSDFPGGFPGDQKNAFTGAGLTEREREAQQLVRTLFTWRRETPVVHHGRLMHYTPIERNVYAYFRYDVDDTVMVIMNRSSEPVTVDMRHFAERLGDSEEAREVLTGRQVDIGGELVLEPVSVLLLEIER